MRAPELNQRVKLWFVGLKHFWKKNVITAANNFSELSQVKEFKFTWLLTDLMKNIPGFKSRSESPNVAWLHRRIQGKF